MFKSLQFSHINFNNQPKFFCILFTAGCNFDCLWCHNRILVEKDKIKTIPDLKEKDIKKLLLSKKNKIDGVNITGGEPTLWGSRLLKFMKWCKENGFLVRLNTNGYLPDVLKTYIDANVLDFIAMDIKNSFEKYGMTVNKTNLDINRIKKSAELIKSSKIPYQFQTTLVPNLHTREDIEKIEEFLKEEVFIQNYNVFCNFSYISI